MRWFGSLFVLVSLLCAASAPHAALFTVDTTEDTPDASTADGRCADALGRCALRAAIEQANALPGSDRIEFALAGPLPHVIAIGAAPTIVETVTLDATTQPGSRVNAATKGTDAVWGVTLRGVGSGLLSFQVDAPNVVIRGLEFECMAATVAPCVLFGPDSAGSRFRGNRISGGAGAAIRVDSTRVRIGDPAPGSRNWIHDNVDGVHVTGSGNFVVNNLIGADATGSGPLGNAGTGIFLEGGSNTVADNLIAANGVGIMIWSDLNQLLRNQIGGESASNLGNLLGIRLNGSDNQIGVYADSQLTQGNAIVGNRAGIEIAPPSTRNHIAGNRIGAIGQGNVGIGVEILGSSGNHVENNLIAYNGVGIKVREIFTSPTTPPVPAVDNDIESNRYWANAQASIQLANSGSPHNDVVPGLPPDFDEGPNHLQNTPLITYVSVLQGSTAFGGYIDAQTGRYRIDFHSNPFCSFAARAGEYFVASTFIDATGTAAQPRTQFAVEFPVTAQGQGFTATATDEDGNTSELSPCFSAALAGGADLVVAAALDATTLNPGEAVRLTLSVENRGPFVATNVPVAVALPSGFFSPWTPVAGFDPATQTWTIPVLAANETLTLELDAIVVASAAGRLAMSVSAEDRLEQYDANLLDNRVALGAFVRSGADLVVDQTAPLSAQDGQRVRIGVSVENTGPEAAVGVTLSGTLDEGLVFESADVGSGFGYTPATRRWTWRAGDLPDGASATIQIEARVDAALAPDTALQHTVGAFATRPSDPLPSLSSVVVGLGATADLGATIQTGGSLEIYSDWTLTATRLGPESVDRFRWKVECSPGTRLFVRADSLPAITPTATCPTSADQAIACPLDCEGRFDAGGSHGQVYLLRDPNSAIAASVNATIAMDPGSPYYDPTPANDSANWFPDYGGLLFLRCGLIGIEGPIFLGIVAWLRRRAAGRRADRVGSLAARSRHTPRRLPAALIAVIALSALAPRADAVPIAFTIDEGASRLAVGVTSALGSPAAVDASLRGAVDAEVTLAVDPVFGTVAQHLASTGATIALADFEVALASPFLFDLRIVGASLRAGLEDLEADAFPVAPGRALFDAIGSAIRFDQGTVRVFGESFGEPVDAEIDLAQTPLRSILGPQSIAELRTLEQVGDLVTLQLTLPLAATLQLVLGDEPLTVSFDGTLVARGQTLVPEPTSAVLVAIGLLGLAARRRVPNSC